MNPIAWILGGVTSWKTTVTGIVAFIALMLHNLGYFEITPEQQGIIVAFALLVISWFSKDATKTGTPSGA